MSTFTRQGERETGRQGDRERARHGLFLLVSPSPCLLVLLLALVGLPLAWPLVDLLRHPGAWLRCDPGRLVGLAGNTLLLTLGTLGLCLPLGVLQGVLLYRTDIPGRRLLRGLLFLTLFVPLPLFVSGWLGVLQGLPLPLGGLGRAVLLHAAGALPWVVLLVGQGLCWVERDVEENALLDLSPARVLLRVSLPRAGAALWAAVLWVVLQTTGEITVTDVFQYRTLAEEVYTQLVAPELGGGASVLAGAQAVSLALTLPLAGVLLLLVGHWERSLPAAEDLPPPRTYSLGRWRWPVSLALSAFVLALTAFPLLLLLSRAGQEGTPAVWSAGALLHQLKRTALLEGRMLLGSVLLAAVAGVVCAGLGLLLCWVCLDAPRGRLVVFGLLAFAWATPGPVLGLGLKGLIDSLLGWTGAPNFLAGLLWYGPSYAPLLWVDIIRFLPCAVLLVWPVLRLVPREWRDLAQVDGASPVQELRRLFLPLALPACGRAALAVAALSLGELGAGKLVATPGAPGYAMEVFAQLHYGVTPSLAAQSLLLLAAVAGVAAALGLAWGQGSEG